MKTTMLALAIYVFLGLFAASAQTVVYDEIPLRYPWSGYTGSNGGIDSLTVDPFSEENPQSGDICAKISYDSSAEDWAGLFIQATGDWRRGTGVGLDLTGAETLSFWARGDRGGEVVRFGYGYSPDQSGTADSVSDSQSMYLSDSWRQFTLDLKGNDLSNISGLFSLRLDREDNPEGATIYLDDIRYI